MQCKTIVITGASDGIGLETAKALKGQGHRVVLVGRNEAKTSAAARTLDAPYAIADYAELRQVQALAQNLRRDYPCIDVLCHNAGGLFGRRERSRDGYQMTFQVNHLAPFLLTHLLLDQLLENRASLLFTSSAAHRLISRYHPDEPQRAALAIFAYGNSKLMNILTAGELHRRYHARGLSTASYHPGVVASNFAVASASPVRLMYATRLKKWLRMVTVAQGADTLVWLANGEPGRDWQSGGYYIDRKLTPPSPKAQDPALARKLWEDSLAMLAPYLKE